MSRPTDTDPSPPTARWQQAELSHAERRAARYLDVAVALNLAAIAGAVLAAVTPAILATASPNRPLDSISAYWTIEPRLLYVGPFSVAAALLVADAGLSFASPNRRDYGFRWYNAVLGLALAGLTWFDRDNSPIIHSAATVVFFGLFTLVIAYTSALAWTGVPVPQPDGRLSGPTDRSAAVAVAQVALTFLAFLAITAIVWRAGAISFFFFEVFALVNFALAYTQGLIRPFPFRHYEFPVSWLNRLFRALRILPVQPGRPG